MFLQYNFNRIPNIIFGRGKLTKLNDIILRHGKKVLIVTGGSSLKLSGKWDDITESLEKASIQYHHSSLSKEPSPEFVDEQALKFRGKKISCVIGIGGGSATDAGKAISAMIPKQDSIRNYLEGVGTKHHDGKKIPYIAIPTTSGTGSEATKNAVISEVGHHGFKKSLRHDNLVPDFAIIDPELMVSCPPSITAACGMDAFTQLLESYVSPTASPMTDALALNGMNYMARNMIPACTTGAEDIKIRSEMAHGSLMSGITLANAGLGIIHGLASPLGGFFDIPHGIACGTLLAEATKQNIELLKKQGPSGKASLLKHARIGALLEGKPEVNDSDIIKYCSLLTETLEKWTKKLNINRLSKYGIGEEDVEMIVNNAGLKNNPIALSKDDIKRIIINRL